MGHLKIYILVIAFVISGCTITEHDICELACNAYGKSLLAGNLQSAIRKCGIYSYDRTVINDDILKPSEVFISKEVSDTETKSGSGVEREDVERDVSVVNVKEQ